MLIVLERGFIAIRNWGISASFGPLSLDDTSLDL